MLLESLVKATVELQGFRVVTVTGDAGGLVAELAPDRRFVPRCGQCGTRGVPRHPSGTALPPCTAVGDPGGAALCAAPRGVPALRRRACRVDALGAWEAADDARTAGDTGDVGPRLALGAVDGGACGINSPIQIAPAALDPHIGFINTPGFVGWLEMPAQPLLKFRCFRYQVLVKRA